MSESLFEQRHGSTLTEYVNAKRQARPRWPWQLIADELRRDTDAIIDVTHETLRQWYGSTDATSETGDAA